MALPGATSGPGGRQYIGRMWSLPSVCQVCGAWPGRPVCVACRRRFAPPVERCPRCARATPGGGLCGECLTSAVEPAVRHCVAAVDYAYPWDGLVARLKFRQEPGWATPLADVMWQRARAAGLGTPDSLWVPVPVSHRRLIERGYNQAWELCRALRRLSGRPALADALVRVGDSPDQHQLPHSLRLTNLRGAFAAHPERADRLRHAHVVLVDDVRTTGATLEHAATALRRAGCAQVDALVFARTAHPGET